MELNLTEIKNQASPLFNCKTYGAILEVVKLLWPSGCYKVDSKLWTITVDDGRVKFIMNLSGNETKIYFDTFRTFSLEATAPYLQFKKQESELIKSIEG